MFKMIGLFVACIAFYAFILIMDSRWYKRHPGANERMAEVDDELTAKGL